MQSIKKMRSEEQANWMKLIFTDPVVRELAGKTGAGCIHLAWNICRT
jgi:hypothetical protein